MNIDKLPKAWGIIGKSELDDLYDIYYQIAATIFEYRTKHNLTQKQLAEKLGITPRMVAKLESGDECGKFYTIERLWEIAKKLGFKFDFVFEESPCEYIEAKRTVFEKTNVIHDPTIRDFVRECLEMAPSYFWVVPASSSGKYHPTFAAGEGGLVRHTLAAVAVAEELFPAYPELERDRDKILAALFLHDTLKYGRDDSGHTVEDHPLLPQMYYYQKVSLIGEDVYRRIMAFIRTHMGVWGPAWGPGTPAEECGYRISPAEFVHLCDYIASRRGLEQIFTRGESK